MNLGAEGPQSAQQYGDVTHIRLLAPGERTDALPESALSRYIIAISSSTGGPEVLTRIFRKLPAKMPGIVVVQHIPKEFTKSLSERLNRELPFAVTEAENGSRVLPGSMHIALESNQITIRRQGAGWVTENRRNGKGRQPLPGCRCAF